MPDDRGLGERGRHRELAVKSDVSRWYLNLAGSIAMYNVAMMASLLGRRPATAGRPRETVSIKDDILTVLRETKLGWEVRESTWSVKGMFDEESVDVVRVVNPFGPTPAPLS